MVISIYPIHKEEVCQEILCVILWVVFHRIDIVFVLYTNKGYPIYSFWKKFFNFLLFHVDIRGLIGERRTQESQKT